MKILEINDEYSDWEDVFSAWSSYGKDTENNYSFTAKIDSIETIAAFGSCYCEFIKSEQEDDDDDFEGFEELELLRKYDFPDLKAMIDKYPDLLIIVIKKHLFGEFLGSIFFAKSEQFIERKYIVNYVDSIEIANGEIAIIGTLINR